MNYRYIIGILLCVLLLGAVYDISFRVQNGQEAESETEALYEAGAAALYAPEAGAACICSKRPIKTGTVSVYYADGETLYEETGIAVAALPELLRMEVRMGKPLKTIQELYSFLENYSS